MTDMERGRMLADMTIRSAEGEQLTAIDLDLVAEQLSAIAHELRNRDASQPSTPSKADQNGIHSGGNGINGEATIPAHPADIKKRRAAYAKTAREAYATRRRRAAIFGNPELFGEPAWDILLDLYIANVEQKPVSVSSACIGSAAPPTTGLRWLGVLSDHDLILREHDPEDQRRVLVRLTEKGLEAMDRYFASAGRSA